MQSLPSATNAWFSFSTNAIGPQFGENHRAIKNFFPNSQLFGFTGTPIFEQNASSQQIEGQESSLVTTDDVFQKQLHAYTITHAIEDRNVLRFRIEYYKPDGENPPRPGETLAKRAVVERHPRQARRRHRPAHASTPLLCHRLDQRRHRILRACSSRCQAEAPGRRSRLPVRFKVAAVFSPPAEGNKRRYSRLQEDLPQEHADNQQEPDKKKDSASRPSSPTTTPATATNHARRRIRRSTTRTSRSASRISNTPTATSPKKGAEKIDITIVVDMLLTGFDSKYLNTLYVDKNLKHQPRFPR